MFLTRLRTEDRQYWHEFMRNDSDQYGEPYGPQPTYKSGILMGSSKTIADNNHPQFRLRSSQGEVILGDVSLSEYRLEGGTGKVSFGFPGGMQYTYTGSIAPLVVNNMPDMIDMNNRIGRAKDECLIKAYAKMNSSPLLSGETIMTIGQTVSMLKRPLSGVQDLVLQMIKSKKRRTKKTALSALRATQGAWLEYRMGMKPLFMDCSTIIDEVRQSSVSGDQGFQVARAGTKIEEHNYLSGAGVVSNMLFATRCNVSQTKTCSIGAGVIFSVKNRNLPELLLKTAGLDVRSLPATLWELTPWSFVYDWVVGVGPWLQAVVPDTNVTIEGNWRTHNLVNTHVVSEITTDHNYWMYWVGQYHRLYGVFPNVLQTQREYLRECNVNLPRTPVVNDKIVSLLHSLDSVALLTQAICNSLLKMKH